MRNRILDDMRDQLEIEGMEIGTPAYEARFVAIRVDKCKQMQGVSRCLDCQAYDGCSLIKQHMRNKLLKTNDPVSPK